MSEEYGLASEAKFIRHLGSFSHMGKKVAREELLRLYRQALPNRFYGFDQRHERLSGEDRDILNQVVADALKEDV